MNMHCELPGGYMSWGGGASSFGGKVKHPPDLWPATSNFPLTFQLSCKFMTVIFNRRTLSRSDLQIKPPWIGSVRAVTQTIINNYEMFYQWGGGASAGWSVIKINVQMVCQLKLPQYDSELNETTSKKKKNIKRKSPSFLWFFGFKMLNETSDSAGWCSLCTLPHCSLKVAKWIFKK